MPAIDWTKIYKKHKGKWVALKDDEETVISSDKELAKALEKAVKKGFQNPIILKVPEDFLPVVG